MDEYIKKQDIYDELSKDYDYLTNYGKGYVDATIRMVKTIPAADVVEVQHGEWKWDDYTHRYRCSICEAYQPYETIRDNGEEYIDYWDCDYCPLCGAKMDGKDESNV